MTPLAATIIGVSLGALVGVAATLAALGWIMRQHQDFLSGRKPHSRE